MAKFGAGLLGKLNDTFAVPTDLQRVYTGQGSAAAAVGFDLSGVFVGTVVFEATIDDVRWFAVAAHQTGLSGVPGPVTLSVVQPGAGSYPQTLPGVWSVNAHSYSQVRVRMVSYTSGSCVVAAALTASQTEVLVLKELMIANKLLAGGLHPNDPDQDDQWRADPGFGT